MNSKRTVRLWVIFYTCFALNIECAHSMVQLSTGNQLAYKIVMLRSANAKAHHHIIWQHLCVVYQSAYHPRLKSASFVHNSSPKRLRRQKEPTLHDFTHAYKQITLRLHALMLGNSNRWHCKGYWRRFVTVTIQLLIALLKMKFNITVFEK